MNSRDPGGADKREIHKSTTDIDMTMVLVILLSFRSGFVYLHRAMISVTFINAVNTIVRKTMTAMTTIRSKLLENLC